MNRTDLLSSLKSKSPDVLIVGAGINGAGTFRDLALNGVDVLIIDRADFCSGASAASSHMAHGGIRYLENGEFRLVREAVQERNRMIENAAHLVKPLPTVVPMFKLFSGLLNAPFKFLNLLDKPAERGALVIKIGLIFYDTFTRAQKTVPPHKFEGRQKSLEKFPKLAQDIKFTATYYDGQILSPERYTVEVLLDGEKDGGKALNYVSFLGADGNSVSLRDELTDSTFSLQPKLIINAAGPWVDQVNATFGVSERYIGGTKGSHLVLDHPELREAIGKNEFFFENKDGRIVLIFPFYDKVIIGTSDLPIQNPDEARCTPQEEQYFIDLVSRVFPAIKVGPEHIVFRFSGVRPLEYMQAKTTGQITRDHSLKEDKAGNLPVYSLVGGKWTSYRAFGEQVADKALALLGKTRKANTLQMPIGGGRDYPLVGLAQIEYIKKVAEETGLGDFIPRNLFERYGTRALEVAQFVKATSAAPLASLPGWTVGEVRFLIEHEKVVHIDDLLIRRSTLAWLGQVSRPLVEELAEIMAVSLGWDGAHKQAELAHTFHVLLEYHGLRL
ncbi:MAG: glycerol-3-phosphate dehydrogenase/oxidase [Anaerolineales bacterium]|jgi:glycerol-3-phosphate dehydrogenase|nr:glycerol-3-phosphate dehydrogenase/oxidase [Anaerolineales bacterium]